MPELGELKLGKEIGKSKWTRYIWAACGVCGKQRWVTFINGKPKNTLCLSCSRKAHINRVYPTGAATSNWKGGRTSLHPRPRGSKRALVTCEICGEERWSYVLNGKPRHPMCLSCSHKLTGVGTSHWGGGQWHDGKGYLMVKLNRDDFFSPMMNKMGYVMEHRLVMAKHLGRCLQSWERIHHKDGIKDHNELSNLELTDNMNNIGDHNKGYQDGYRKGLTDGRDKQIQDLKAEILMLQEVRTAKSSGEG